jgi:superfamily II DNA or RNA helicase
MILLYHFILYLLTFIEFLYKLSTGVKLKVNISSPTKAFLSEYSDDDLSFLKKQLTYTNTGIQHLIKRHYSSHFWKSRNPDTWGERLKELQTNLKKCLVFEEDGKYYIRPGSIPYLSGFNLEVVNEVQYPSLKKMPWKNPFNFELHPYQEESWQKLIAEKHGNVSLTTGSGKSAIILKLCKEMGLNTCIVVPSKGIFYELIEKFEHHLGGKFVGKFGDGKKKLGKKFTICIGDSLANLELGTEEYEFFSNLDVLIVDESHTFAADSLENICHGVLANIPFRFLLSATQCRNDGSLPLLQSIIGKTVCTLTTEEAVQKNYICPHEYRIVSLESSNPSDEQSDPLAQKRAHFLNNTNIAQFTAKLANAMATTHGKQTLVLCEELSQLAMLIPLLKVPYALAHSEKRTERLKELGLEKVDVGESVEKFNKNEVKVLVTTSCCHTGTNIFPTHSTVSWIGGASEIKTKQAAVGRSVRFGRSNPWASKCVAKEKSIIYDFNILNNFTMNRHLESRIACYLESGPNLITYIRLKPSS